MNERPIQKFSRLPRAAEPFSCHRIHHSQPSVLVAEMRAFRALSFQTRFLNPSLNKSLLNPTQTSLGKYSKSNGIFRHFWSSRLLMFPEESTAVNVDVNGWRAGSKENSSIETFYDATTGQLVTRRVQSHEEASRRKAASNSENSSSSNSSSSQYVHGSESRVYGEVVGNMSGKKKGKGKSKPIWVCSDCGYTDGQWWGVCKECNGVNTLKQFSPGADRPTGGIGISENVMRSWLPHQRDKPMPVKLSDVNKGINQFNWRISLCGLFGTEVERVLGGGLVPGSLVLVGGDPGVGKSTLLLQVAAILSEGRNTIQSAPVVYVSGEESIEQIGNRADRMRIGTEKLFLYTSTDVEDILEKVQRLLPCALIIDSIQTVFLRGVAGSAGSITQVKECTEAFLRFAKRTNIPVLLAGHVTKTGEIAGPRVLEHIVDAVLYMEGEKYSSHRLLRSVKNRFGSTDELGVFEMSDTGLQAVVNPSEMFLSEQNSDSDFLVGLAVAVVMDGSRAFVIEIQEKVYSLQTTTVDIYMRSGGPKKNEPVPGQVLDLEVNDDMVRVLEDVVDGNVDDRLRTRSIPKSTLSCNRRLALQEGGGRGRQECRCGNQKSYCNNSGDGIGVPIKFQRVLELGNKVGINRVLELKNMTLTLFILLMVQMSEWLRDLPLNG
ncbi:unnamed protein product [Cuscuta campestris]|uniref:RecA family profile 1 domain-containing protein n=1 Tax=Cuscuta campestris TaxID=132261 RepID=A0A484M1E1_9ASTE|nr:unnamed protein product [Cuscuta campestris]